MKGGRTEKNKRKEMIHSKCLISSIDMITPVTPALGQRMSSRPTPSYAVRSCLENKTKPHGKYLLSQGKSLELWWAEAEENLNKPEDPFHTISVTSPLSPPKNSHSAILGEAGGLSSSLRSKLSFVKLVISGLTYCTLGKRNPIQQQWLQMGPGVLCTSANCRIWGSEA